MIISDKCKLLFAKYFFEEVKITFLLFAISVNCTFAQKLNWIKEHELHDNGYHWGVATCTDLQGNVYSSSVYRAAYQSSTIGGSFIRKYNKTGDLIWSYYKQALEIRSIVTESNGNLYLSGNFCFNVNLGCGVLNDSVQPWTFFLAKFDPNGNCLWSKKVSNAWATKMAIDNNGFLYIIGGFFTPVNFEGTSIQNGNMGHYVSKFDSNGNCHWFQPMFSGGSPTGVSVKDESVSITGYFFGRMAYFGTDSSTILGGSNNPLHNSYTARYDSSGNLQWAKHTVKGDSEAKGITTDEEGNVYVTGFFEDQVKIEGRECSNDQWRDIFVVKYNSNGDTLGIKIIHGPNFESGTAIYSHNNSIYLSGDFYNELHLVDSVYFTGKGSVFLAKLNEDLDQINWIKFFNSNGAHAEIFQITSDNEENIVAVGDYTNDLQVDSVHLVYNNYMYKKPFVMSIKENDQVISVKETPSVSSFKIYPNPSPSIITIVYIGNSSSNVQLQIKNQLGQTLLTKTLPPQNEIYETLDLSSFAKGIYFIELQSGEAVEVKKIVLE